MINMLRNAKAVDPKREEKIEAYEDKKKAELDEVVADFATKKVEGLKGIKDHYNHLSS
jgi:hypothetical protein